MDAASLLLIVVIAGAIVVAAWLSRISKRTERPADGGIGTLPRVQVRHVIDGDTVVVSTLWSETRLRLYAIDCPEDGQPWGDTATAGLIKMIGGRSVCLETHGVDIHGRTLATIFVQGIKGSEWTNVNERMVMLGHAWVMRAYYGNLSQHRQYQLNRLEEWARGKKVGLWKTSNPIPPWQWRKSTRFR